MNKKKQKKNTTVGNTMHYPSDMSGEQLKSQMEEVLKHVLAENGARIVHNTTVIADEKYEKEKRELELEEKRQALKHGKIASRVGVGTLLTTIFSAILSLFTFFAKPEVRTEKIIIQEGEDEVNEQADMRRYPRPLDPPHELLILKRIASEVPSFKDRLQTAKVSLETGNNPYYVQNELVNDLTSLKEQAYADWSKALPGTTISANNVDQVIRYLARPNLITVTARVVKPADKKD